MKNWERISRDFMELAACANQDPEMWFPSGDDGITMRRSGLEAKAVCKKCPVKRECKEYAKLTGANCGIWGGLTIGEIREEQYAERRRRLP